MWTPVSVYVSECPVVSSTLVCSLIWTALFMSLSVQLCVLLWFVLRSEQPCLCAWVSSCAWCPGWSSDCPALSCIRCLWCMCVCWSGWCVDDPLGNTNTIVVTQHCVLLPTLHSNCIRYAQNTNNRHTPSL